MRSVRRVCNANEEAANMKKGSRRSIWMWLVLVAIVLGLFGPTVFAGAGDILDLAKAVKGQYTWCPECVE